MCIVSIILLLYIRSENSLRDEASLGMRLGRSKLHFKDMLLIFAFFGGRKLRSGGGMYLFPAWKSALGMWRVGAVQK